MAIDKTIKKQIIEDWQIAFPQLSPYTQNKLYQVVGPVLIGLELIKLPRTEEYRPHFVIYPLWKQNAEKTLDIPILLNEYYNKKGLQFNIPYEKHSVFFDEALDSVKKQTLLPFAEKFSLKKILSVLDVYSKSRPLSAAPNSYLQAVLYEAKLKISLYVGINEARNILEEIKNKPWDLNHFTACGINLEKWLDGVEKLLLNRDEFLNQIEVNKLDKKIAKLNSSELIP